MSNRRPSLQDRIRQRQHSEFVGRDDQLALFRRNFGLPLGERIYIHNIFGQGGVGKTTLLRRYREIASASGALTALADHDQTDVLTTMDRLAGDLMRQGHELRAFADRYHTYRQRRQELESELDAPTGLSSLFARTLVKGGLSLARGIPVGGGLVDLVDGDAVAAKTGEWVEYVARKLRNNTDEIRLIREPIEELTRLWLDDLNKIADKSPIILFFDTYERTGLFLDAWLRDLLGGSYGPLSDTTQLVIAGRDELDRNLWSEYESVIARCSLAPFTEQEARNFLSRKGVINEQVVKVILHLSGRLPLLVATLAAERPDDPAKVGDPSGTAVERFLVWTEEPILRRAAVDAALPRHFNRDLIALLVEEKQVDAVFEWLRHMPFVEERSDGWAYHVVVREQMLRYKRRESQQSWATLHNRIAEYYEQIAALRKPLDKECWSDQFWCMLHCEAVYHRLCSSYHQSLSTAVGEVLTALEIQFHPALQCANAIVHAEEDTNIDEVQRSGRHLRNTLDAYYTQHFDAFVTLLTDLLSRINMEPRGLAVAYTWRATGHFFASRYEQALADLTRAIEVDPKYARAWIQRSAIFVLLSRYDMALADLDSVISFDSQNTWALAQRGMVHRLGFRYDEGLADFTRAIELNPQNLLALAGRGMTLVRVFRYDEALTDLNTAIALNPPDEIALLVRIFRSAIHQLFGREDAASADLNAIVTADLNAITTFGPQNGWMLTIRAGIYGMLGRFDQALADFSRAIELYPHLPIMAYRGALYVDLGRYDEALADLSRALKLNAEDTLALAYRGEVYRQLDRGEEALADFNRAIELNSQNAWVLARRGKIYGELACYTEALTDLGRAIDLNSQDPWPLAVRGDIYLQLERYDEALADLMRAIELDPQDPWALALRGQVYQQLERYNEALADLSRTIKLNPQSAAVLGVRGEVYRHLKCYDEALADLTRAIELDSEDAWALKVRGEVYLDLERYDEALADLTQAIELESQDSHTLGIRGRSYRRLHRYNEALVDLSRAIELSPRDAWLLTERGVIYQQLERYNEALSDLNSAIDLNSQNPWALVVRSQICRELERYDEALADLSLALELAPHEASILVMRGEIYRQLNRHEEALTNFSYAIELDPENAWALTRRGEVYQQLNRYEDALTDFTHVVDLDPQYAGAFRQRGVTCRQLKRNEEALIDLSHAIELESDNDWYIYERALVYLLQYDQLPAEADLARAIELASASHEKSPTDWNNSFNLALYLLVSGQSETSRNHYHNLAREAPANEISIALNDLSEYLASFPDNSAARAMRADLQTEFERRQGDATAKP